MVAILAQNFTWCFFVVEIDRATTGVSTVNCIHVMLLRFKTIDLPFVPFSKMVDFAIKMSRSKANLEPKRLKNALCVNVFE